MSDPVQTIAELRLEAVLGEQFGEPANQSWLASWARRWMALARTGAGEWQSLGTEMIEGVMGWSSGEADWLEIDVELKRRPKGEIRGSRAPDPIWTLNLDLQVACWCQDNHNAHYVEQHGWDVGTIGAFTQRTQDVLEITEQWLATSIDAEYWRQQAGLPQRRSLDMS